MRKIYKGIEIDASAEMVWQLLTDFASLPRRSPFIRQISRELRAGTQLVVRVQLSGTRSWTVHGTVLKAEQNRELCLAGRQWIPKLFDDEHHFTIEPLAVNRVRFARQVVFIGILAPVLTGTIAATERSLEEMNYALRVMAEQPA